LLVRDGSAQEIRMEGVPLGLFPDSEYDETTIDLQPGDIVLFASDGILESENPREEEFGSARLHALLASTGPEISANELSEKIIAATDDHSGPGLSPHDDRTLLVLRVSSEATADYSKLPVIY
jgi:sigma-B regulation protein RsbU (phosphoserine phosphatase)